MVLRVLVVSGLAATASAFAPASGLRSSRIASISSTESETEWAAPPMPESDSTDEAVPSEVAAVQKAPRTSLALPFMNAPAILDGTLAGDMGFDPLGFADCRENLLVYREAEVKHARLAMLAAAGWPLAELYHKSIASSAGLPSILNTDGRNPSVLNGFTGPVSASFVVAAFAMVGLVEGGTLKSQYISPQDFNQRPASFAQKESEGLVSGGYNFDPLNLYNFFGPGEEGRQIMRTSELKNGRLAMMAITGMAIQEAMLKKPVVDQTPLFFKPIWESVAALLTGDVPALYTEEGINTKFGTSAPLESFQYPSEDEPAAVVTAPVAATTITAAPEVDPVVEFSTAVPSVVEEAVPAATTTMESTASVIPEVAAAAAPVEVPTAPLEAVADAASAAVAAVAEAMPSVADVAEVATKVADVRDMGFPDFSGL